MEKKMHTFVDLWKNKNNKKYLKNVRRYLEDNKNSKLKIRVSNINYFKLNLDNKEKRAIKSLIKNNINRKFDNIARNISTYNISNFDETLNYIDHQITSIGNILFSFNQLLIDLVITYCVENQISFYSSEDNNIIKSNLEVFNEVKDFFSVEKNIILMNNSIEQFNMVLNMVKINKNNPILNIEENKNILKNNNILFNSSKYYNKKSLLMLNKLEEINKTALNCITIIKKNKLLNKDEQNQILNNEINFKFQSASNMIKELELLMKEDEYFFIKLNEIEKNFTLEGGNNDFSCLQDIKFLISYNKLIKNLKTYKLKKLNVGLENLFSINNQQGNNNSLHKLLDFFVKHNTIPEFLMKEIYIYENLFRHQYAHGWHDFFYALLFYGRNFTYKTNADLYKSLEEIESKKNLSNLRSNLK